MWNYISAGLFTSEAMWTHPKRCIQSYEIIYVLKGEVHICEEGIPYTLTEKQVLLLEPGHWHWGNTASANVSFYWLHFTGTSKPDFKYFTPRNPYEIESQLKRLLHIDNTFGYPPSSVEAAVLLFINELSFQSKNVLTASNGMLQQLCEYVRIHADHPLTVAGVAAHFGYTSGYISKAFRAEFRISLKKHIELERLKFAKSLLITTSLSVKQIARSMHYAEEKNFIKFFVYHEKISPTQYRNQYFNTHMNNK